MRTSNLRKKSYKSLGIGAIVTVVLVIIDQLTKYLAASALKDNDAFSMIPGVFELRYLENTSAAFGMDIVSMLQSVFQFPYFLEHPEALLTWKMGFFFVFTVIVLFFMVLVYMKIPETKKFRYLDWILVMFISGAIGNLIDRIWHNYVIDFFYFRLINFPIFNVADIYVTLAAFFLIVLGIFYYKEEDYDVIMPPKEKKAAAEKAKKDNEETVEK